MISESNAHGVSQDSMTIKLNTTNELMKNILRIEPPCPLSFRLQLVESQTEIGIRDVRRRICSEIPECISGRGGRVRFGFFADEDFLQGIGADEGRKAHTHIQLERFGQKLANFQKQFADD